jgi:hypothetical protein
MDLDVPLTGARFELSVEFTRTSAVDTPRVEIDIAIEREGAGAPAALPPTDDSALLPPIL